MASASHRHGLADWLVLGCGVWLVGLGLYFIFVRPTLLPEDVRYISFDPQVLAAAAPALGRWLGKVFTVMGGFIAGAGVLVMHFGLRAMPARTPGTTVVLALVGALTVGLMSGVNFALHSDFRWVLILPPIVWLFALARYAWVAVHKERQVSHPSEPCLLGQLCIAVLNSEAQ